MWTYHQSTGAMDEPEGTCLTEGYAGGNCGRNPEGRNNPTMQDIHFVGPLPRGMYTIGEAIEHSWLGPCAMPLTPDWNNIMFNRGGFYIHGDSPMPGFGSEGCIVISASAREIIAASKDRRLLVVD